MDNKELLLKMGFFERDGWLCNPSLNGEAVFKLNDPNYGCENISLETLARVISASASNYGSRWQRDESNKRLADMLRREADLLEGIAVVEDAGNDED